MKHFFILAALMFVCPKIHANEVELTGADFKSGKFKSIVGASSLMMAVNGSVSKEVSLLKGLKYKLAVNARGSKTFDQFASFKLYLDNKLLNTYTTVGTTSAYEVDIVAENPKSVIRIEYFNDSVDRVRKKDRNLILDGAKLTFLDKTAPVIKDLMSSKTVQKNAAASVVYSITDKDSGLDESSLKCELNSKALAKCSSPLNLGVLAAGDYSVKISAQDKAGNKASSVIPFSVVAGSIPDSTTIKLVGSVVQPAIVIPGDTVTADISVSSSEDASPLVVVMKLKNVTSNKIVVSKTISDVSFLKNQKKKISADLVLPKNAEVGNYELEYGVFTKDYKKTFLYMINMSSLLVESSRYKVAPGKKLDLIGVNLSGGEYALGKIDAKINFNYTYPTIKEIKYFAAQGMNIIRLPFDLNRVQKKRFGALDQVEVKRIADVVDLAKANGLKVILDPHNYARMNDDNGVARIIGVDPLMPSSNLADFWGKFSTALIKKDNAIFMLMNEPYGIKATIWKETAVDAINAIRDTGSKHLILIPGVSWTGGHSWISSGNGAAWAGFQDENFAFEVHQYLDKDSSGTNSACTVSSGSKRLVAFTKWAKENNVKGLLGEIGWEPNANCYKEGRDIMAYMHSNPDVWMGFTYWSAGPWMSNYFQTIQPIDIGSATEIETSNISIIKQFIDLKP